jgi:N4-(beta-N-acetylglucosaminyl)-L-asparaginase
MSKNVSRRDFLKAGTAAAGLGIAAPQALAGSMVDAPAVVARRSRPIVVSSGNGHQYRNDGELTCVETVFRGMTNGEDVLDAIIDGVRINELDPGDASVGYGGLPNGDGVVQLDASCMHGPRKAAGAVACLEGVRTPAAVARAVMNETDHHLLVGPDAQRFARNMGFTIEDDLNSDASRARWLDWKRRTDPSRWPGEGDPDRIGFLAGMEMVEEGLIEAEHYWGTINCNAVNAAGEIAGCTTTSGLAWKIPGRVGDSPILGAGLYVDGSVGAAGSTGRGEANLFSLASYQIVESMRNGMTPLDAGMDAVRRIRKNTIAPRLLTDEGEPAFGINFYIVNAEGEHAGVTLRGSGRYAVCTENGPELVAFESLL